MRLAWASAGIVCALVTPAHAEDGATLRTELHQSADHADLASRACALRLTAVVGGQEHAIRLRALEDGVLLCATETHYPDEVVISLEMSSHDDPTRIVLRLVAPAEGLEDALPDYRGALGGAEAAVRKLDAAPIVLSETPPMTPSLTEARATTPPWRRNRRMVVGGAIMMTIPSIITSIVGGAVTGSKTYPGTSPAWPFVPFVGMTVFSATYTQVPDCNCPSDRPMSLLLSGLLDGVEIAGLILVLVGATTWKEPRTARLSITPGGIGWAF